MRPVLGARHDSGRPPVRDDDAGNIDVSQNGEIAAVPRRLQERSGGADPATVSDVGRGVSDAFEVTPVEVFDGDEAIAVGRLEEPLRRQVARERPRDVEGSTSAAVVSPSLTIAKT